MSDADYLTDFDPGWEQVDDGVQDWQEPAVLPVLEVGGIFGSTFLIIAS